MASTYKTITETPGWFNRLTDDGVPDSAATLYKSVPYLFRVIQLRCDTLASVPVKIYNGEEEAEWPYPTPLSELLWKWEASSMLAGAAYGEILRNDSGYQKDVVYRNPHDMQVAYNKGVLEIKQNSSGAMWRNDLSTGDYEIFYLAEYDPAQDVLPGVGAAKAANVDIKLLYALAKFPEMFFEGGAMPVTLLGIDSTDKGEITRIEGWFKQSATAIKNAFRVLGVRAGAISPTTLTPPLKDMILPELNDIAKHNIAVAFGVKQTLLDSEAANYATALEDRKSFYSDTIQPTANKIKAAIDRQILNREGMTIEFDFGEIELFQEDENQRAELLKQLVLSGLPLSLALDMAGYDLTDEQLDVLNDAQAESEAREVVERQPRDTESALREELSRWMRMAENRVSAGKSIREFESDIIPTSLHGAISGALEGVKTVEEVRRLFTNVIAWEGYP